MDRRLDRYALTASHRHGKAHSGQQAMPSLIVWRNACLPTSPCLQQEPERGASKCPSVVMQCIRDWVCIQHQSRHLDAGLHGTIAPSSHFLAVTRRLSVSTPQQALSTLLFLDTKVPGRPLPGAAYLASPQPLQHLPVLHSDAEWAEFIAYEGVPLRVAQRGSRQPC